MKLSIIFLLSFAAAHGMDKEENNFPAYPNFEMQEWEKEVLMRRLDISGGSVLIKTAEQIEREQAQARIAAAQYYQKPLYGTPSEKKEFAERRRLQQDAIKHRPFYGTPSEKKEFAERRKQQEDAMRQESFLKARQLKNVSKKQWVQKAKKDDEK